MRKFLLSLVAVIALCFASVAYAKSIRIGTEGAYPPWNNLNSAGELEGAEIDYCEELIGSSFKINNPNATSSCGCGTSFSFSPSFK